MPASCVRCGGQVADNGGTYKCRCCGATFSTLDELLPKRKPQPVAYSAPQQQSASQTAYATQSAYTPQSSYAPSAVNIPQATSAPCAICEMEPEDIYEQTCRGVVEILTEAGRASGFLISKKGFVLTNAHAILNGEGTPCSNISVRLGEKNIPTRLIAYGDTDNANPHNVDLALLAMEHVPADAIALTLGESSGVKIGQHVYYIGNSKGEGLCMTAGIVSDNLRQVGERHFIMTDAATNPGNSGGPLFNSEGQVIGVHVSARLEAVGMKYAIPMDTVRQFLNKVEDQLSLSHNTLADHALPMKKESMESVSAGVVLTLVLSGISLLIKNIEFVKEIFDSVS